VCARELADFARRLHEWAQLLKLANGFLRDRVLEFRQPLAVAIAEAGQRLAARGLPAFDDPKAKEYEVRHKSVAAVIGLNQVIPPSLLTKHPSLTPPGAETARLESHDRSVMVLTVLPDGRLASGSVSRLFRDARDHGF
jgi:hypothetical protein